MGVCHQYGRSQFLCSCVIIRQLTVVFRAIFTASSSRCSETWKREGWREGERLQGRILQQLCSDKWMAEDVHCQPRRNSPTRWYASSSSAPASSSPSPLQSGPFSPSSASEEPASRRPPKEYRVRPRYARRRHGPSPLATVK